MSGVNKVILVGHLGKDPEERQSKAGMTICKFSLATSSKRKGEEETEWHYVVAFGNTADACVQYLAKGRQVYVEGKLHYGSYDDKDGVTRYTTEILADTVQFLGGGGEGRQQQRSSKPTQQDYSQQDKDDDIPF